MRKINSTFVINKTKSAFTLAEVLITLVIIGVVAAMTVPTLMQGTQRQEFAVALKKAHSVLCQAMMRIGSKYGYPGGDYDFLQQVNFLDEFADATNTVKKCNTTAECWGSSLSSADDYKLLNNSSASGWVNGKSVITADGVMYTFVFARSISNIYGLSEEDKSKALGRIIIDVNGQKKPNKFGIDTFIFYVVDGKGVLPAGQYNASDCTRTGRGATCAAKVIRESKISY